MAGTYRETDDVPFEVGRRVQDEGILVQGDGDGVVEPGVDGGGGHLPLHQGEHLGPDISRGIHPGYHPFRVKFQSIHYTRKTVLKQHFHLIHYKNKMGEGGRKRTAPFSGRGRPRAAGGKEAGLVLEGAGGHNMLYREKGCKKRCIQGEKI